MLGRFVASAFAGAVCVVVALTYIVSAFFADVPPRPPVYHNPPYCGLACWTPPLVEKT